MSTGRHTINRISTGIPAGTEELMIRDEVMMHGFGGVQFGIADLANQFAARRNVRAINRASTIQPEHTHLGPGVAAMSSMKATLAVFTRRFIRIRVGELRTLRQNVRPKLVMVQSQMFVHFLRTSNPLST